MTIQQDILEQVFNEGESSVRQLVQTIKEHGLTVLRAQFPNLFDSGTGVKWQGAEVDNRVQFLMNSWEAFKGKGITQP